MDSVLVDMCKMKCKSELMLYGAILDRCWKCFQKYIRENPECIHHSIRIPQCKLRSQENIYISDKDGNILYEPKQKYLCKTMTDILMENLKYDSTNFTYKALKYMMRNKATYTQKGHLFHIYTNITDTDDEDFDNGEVGDYYDRQLKLMSIALDHGWYEPAPGSQKQDENLWITYLIDIMWLTDILYFDFKKLVWQFLENGEELVDHHETPYKYIFFPYFKLEEKKKEMGIEENARLSGKEKEDLQKEIWLEYAEKMKTYISEYYSQECMKEAE